jgi:hypothetical protein
MSALRSNAEVQRSDVLGHQRPPKSDIRLRRNIRCFGLESDILSEPELLQAMFDVGYFPPNTPVEPQH